MTQKEFTDRTGMTPCPEDFEYIHSVYMNTSMDKDIFCEEFKRTGDNAILREVNSMALAKESTVLRQADVIKEVADFLIMKSCDLDSSEFYYKAVGLIGHCAVVKRKLAQGLPLCSADIEYINQNLE